METAKLHNVVILRVELCGRCGCSKMDGIIQNVLVI
jgi:hypothetical protein